MDILSKLKDIDIPIAAAEAVLRDDDYKKLLSYTNVTSFSSLSVLHVCPRKFQMMKSQAADPLHVQMSNVDFAYGHAIGAGVAAYFASDGDEKAMLLAAFKAWTIPFDAKIEKKHKTIWDTWIACMKFIGFAKESLSEWQVWKLPNGKPAIEVSFSVDLENGFKHYGHIDVILEHRETGQLAVFENKTHGFYDAEAALYANSSQGISYAVLIDQLRNDTSYEIFYCCYSSVNRKWELLPFTKTVEHKAEWLADVRLDHAAISTYMHMDYWPKRGESCYNFVRRCEYFGECNMAKTLKSNPLPVGQEAEAVDFSFTLSEILETQRLRNQQRWDTE